MLILILKLLCRLKDLGHGVQGLVVFAGPGHSTPQTQEVPAPRKDQSAKPLMEQNAKTVTVRSTPT